MTQNNEYKEILSFQTLGSGDRTLPGQIPDPRSGRIVNDFYVGTKKNLAGLGTVFFLLFVCF